jgi:hypothetical protein
LYDHEDRFKTDAQRAELHEQKATAAQLDKRVNEIEKYTKAFTRAVLLLSGYHAPRRQWRKIRQ